MEEPARAGKGEAPTDTGQQEAITPALVKLVNALVEEGNERILFLLWQDLETERNRLAERYGADDPEDTTARGDFARAVERAMFVNLKLQALRQASAPMPLIAEDV